MTGLTADIIGICGSLIFIAAFAYTNMAKVMNKLWFNVANLVGAILLLTSLSIHFNLAAVILELAWAAIALAGIIGALRVQENPVP
jgi:hypothetical protein